MSLAALAVSEECFDYRSGSWEGGSSVMFDIAVIITGIFVGAFALSGFIDLPPTAAYAALGVGCGFLVMDAVALSYQAYRRAHSHGYEVV